MCLCVFLFLIRPFVFSCVRAHLSLQLFADDLSQSRTPQEYRPSRYSNADSPSTSAADTGMTGEASQFEEVLCWAGTAGDRNGS